MSSKQRAIKILNSAGGSHTNRQKALKYISTGRARYVDEHTIEMIEDDPRHQACIAGIADGSSRKDSTGCLEFKAPRHSPTFDLAEWIDPPERDGYFGLDGPGQTFLHYPQPGAFRRAA